MANKSAGTDPLKIIKIILVLVGVFLTWIAFYGSTKWYAVEAGLALEKRQTAVEHKMDVNHQLQLVKHEHTVEKLEDIHADFNELKQIIKDIFPHNNNPGR